MTDTKTRPPEDSALDPPAADAAVNKIPYPTANAGWLNIFAPLALVSLVLSIVAIVIAVNADSTTVIQSGDSGDSAAAATSLDVEMKEFEFLLSSSSIAADTDVSVSMENTGAVEHNFVVLQEGVDPSSGANIAEGNILVQFADLGAGASSSETLNLPAASYVVVCLIPGHFDAGMSTTLRVAS